MFNTTLMFSPQRGFRGYDPRKLGALILLRGSPAPIHFLHDGSVLPNIRARRASRSSGFSLGMRSASGCIQGKDTVGETELVVEEAIHRLSGFALVNFHGKLLPPQLKSCSYGRCDQRQVPHMITRTKRNKAIPAKLSHTSMAHLTILPLARLGGFEQSRQAANDYLLPASRCCWSVTRGTVRFQQASAD
jgi:hypothetical protein